MDIFDLLKQDHREVEELVASIESDLESEDYSSVKDNFRKLRRSLVIHSRAEEESVYQPIHLMVEDGEEDMGLEGEEEHHVVDIILEELTFLRPENIRWKYKFKVFKEILEHHVEEEESEIFDQMREDFKPEELTLMADQFRKIKEVYLQEFREPERQFDQDEVFTMTSRRAFQSQPSPRAH